MMIIGVATLYGFYSTADIAANRFGFLKWALPLEFAYPILLLVVTGYSYFTSIIPDCWAKFLYAHNIYTLDTMLWWITTFVVMKSLLCLVGLMYVKARYSRSNL